MVSAAHATPAQADDADHANGRMLGLSMLEFVLMAAGLMSLNALAIDIMLPALDRIATDLQVTHPNDRQLVVVIYVLGFGVPQLVFGPIADRYGRRPTLFISLIGYTLTGLLCVLVTRFDYLLLARFCQGVFAAGVRVVAVAVARDAASGASMARVMSLVLTVFMVVPIVAPGLGQLILYVGPWQWCFGALACAGTVMLAWTAWRLPESTDASSRREHTLRQRVGSYKVVLANRVSMGYMLAGGCLFGGLFGFISTSEQIFRDVFHQGDSFALWFAAVAFAMSVGNMINSRWVLKVGTRPLSHGALIAFVVLMITALLITLLVGDQLFVFVGFVMAAFLCFGIVAPNLNATAMEPLGQIAGTGSAAFGFVTTTGSGLLGGALGRAYNGTTVPLLIGYCAFGLAALLILFITERGRLFVRHG